MVGPRLRGRGDPAGRPPRRGWGALLLGAALVVVLVPATGGCGSGRRTTSRVPGRTGFGGIAYRSMGAVAFAGGGAGAVMVDGLAGLDGGAHVRARFVPAKGAAMKTFDDHESVPLDGVTAWLSGTDLVVAGIACPRWSPTTGAAADGSDVAATCGATRQVVLHLDLEAGRWTTITDHLDPQLVPLHPSVGDAPFALLGVRLDARMLPDGHIERLDASELPAGASEAPCVNAGGALAYVTSSGADRAGLGTFALRGTRWERLDAHAGGEDAPGSWTSHLCTVDGFAVSHVAPGRTPSSELVTMAPSGATTRTEIAPPPIDASPRIPTMSVDAGGHLLATDPGDGSTVALGVDVWQPIAERIPDGARATILVDGHMNWIRARGDNPGGVVSPTT